MEWQFNNDRPIYQQIIEQLELALVSGAFKPGERLPGVRELAEQAGVNPNTMQRALSELEAKGLLFSQRTAGRFVSEDAEEIEALRKSLAKNLGHEYYSGMQRLGYNPPQIMNLIKLTIEEEK